MHAARDDPTNAPSAPFREFADLCDTLGRTAGRLERTHRLAAYLRTLNADEAELATHFLLGRTSSQMEGRRLGLGGRALWQAAEAAGADFSSPADGAVDAGERIEKAMPARPVDPPLALADVRRGFADIAALSGAGSRAARVERLAEMFRRATPVEAKVLAKIVVGEMRQGVQEGILLEAAAALAELTADETRRALRSLADLGALVHRARTDPASLRAVGTRLFHPIKPMLAQAAADVGDAIDRLGELALEYKLDGARVQIHRRGDEVKIFSRRLQDLTRSLPDVVAAVREQAAAPTAIFEGEVIAVDADLRPLPFQDLMRRFRRVRDVDASAREVPVRLYLFDLLYEGDRSCLDDTFRERGDALERTRGTLERVPRMQTRDRGKGIEFFRAALAAGHEGVMAKALDSPYTPGVRGAGWLKVKHSVTLDLVIVAADWGYGRRHEWLSNYHLAARDPSSGALLEVGKTFKGPTDAEFRAMTARLLDLKESEVRGTVRVRPEIVVEVRFDGIQKSPRYPSGMALRFARIVRVRDDKPAAEADTIDALRRLFDGQSRPV